MSPSKIITLLFSLIFLSYVVSSTELYETICKDARSDENRCQKLLQSNPQITSAKDYPNLCKFILVDFIGQATKAQTQLQDLVKKYPSSNAIKQCATSDYGNLIISFRSSLSELVEDPKSANYDAKEAGDGPDACARALANEKIVNDPFISTLNNDMYFLSNVAYLATNHLGHE